MTAPTSSLKSSTSSCGISRYMIFFLVFVSLVFFDLVSSVQVSPRHSAVIITFLGEVYFIFLGCLVFKITF